MKKIKFIISIIFLMASMAFAVYLFYQYRNSSDGKTSLITEIITAQNNADVKEDINHLPSKPYAQNNSEIFKSDKYIEYISFLKEFFEINILLEKTNLEEIQQKLNNIMSSKFAANKISEFALLKDEIQKQISKNSTKSPKQKYLSWIEDTIKIEKTENLQKNELDSKISDTINELKEFYFAPENIRNFLEDK
jgi:hypothetical protein